MYFCSFLNLLNSIVSLTVFLQYVIYAITMCFELYLVSKSTGGFIGVVRSLLYIIGLFVQMLICFCIPSTMLTIEAADTQNVIYETKWYQCPYTSIRKNVIIMMIRLRGDIALTAGNLFFVNLETCTE
ncbi:7tm 6 domain containing protein, partial [Asbolus verrucosus]